MQKYNIRPFTNSTNSALDCRVQKRTLRPLTDSTKLSLYRRVQKGHSIIACKTVITACGTSVQNSHCHLKQSPPCETFTAVQNICRRLEQSPPFKMVTAVQKNLSVFLIFLSFRNRYEQSAQNTVTKRMNTERNLGSDNLN